MGLTTQSVEALKKQITDTEKELKILKEQLANIEARDDTVQKAEYVCDSSVGPVTQGKWPLSAEEYKRYGRQMIVPSIGIKGQSLLFL